MIISQFLLTSRFSLPSGGSRIHQGRGVSPPIRLSLERRLQAFHRPELGSVIPELSKSQLASLHEKNIDCNITICRYGYPEMIPSSNIYVNCRILQNHLGPYFRIDVFVASSALGCVYFPCQSIARWSTETQLACGCTLSIHRLGSNMMVLHAHILLLWPYDYLTCA